MRLAARYFPERFNETSWASGVRGVRLGITTPEAWTMPPTSQERCRHRGYEVRGRSAAGRGRRSLEGLLRGPGVAPGCRLPLRQRLPGRPVHAAQLGVLHPVRGEDDLGRARVGPGSVPDRV